VNLNDLDDAEKFQRHFVAPMVDAVRAELAPLVKSDQAQEARIAKLEGNQKKAMAAYAVIALLGSMGLTQAKAWVAKKFNLNI
jgi:hypothetical protein